MSYQNNSLFNRFVNNFQVLGKRNKHKVVFIHPPKCGGTSIFHAIKKNYGIYQSFMKSAIINLSNTDSKIAAEKLGTSVSDYREYLLVYFLHLKDIKLIYGHFYFPNKLDEDEVLFNDWNFVTLFRDPFDRWFSHYFFNYTIDSGNKEDNKDLLNIKLQKFLTTEKERAQDLGKSYVSILSGRDLKNEIITDAIINKAKKNMKKFKLVGRLEDLESFQRSFNEIFDASIKIRSINRNVNKPNYENIFSEELLRSVKDMCEPNYSLYNHIRKK